MMLEYCWHVHSLMDHCSIFLMSLSFYWCEGVQVRGGAQHLSNFTPSALTDEQIIPFFSFICWQMDANCYISHTGSVVQLMVSCWDFWNSCVSARNLNYTKIVGGNLKMEKKHTLVTLLLWILIREVFSFT